MTRPVSRRVRRLQLLPLAVALLHASCTEGPFLVSGVAIGTVTLSQTNLTLVITEADSVTVSVLDVDGVEVLDQPTTWTSENTAVATVAGTSTGATITAVGEGSARIVVTVGGVSSFLNLDVFASAFEIDVRFIGAPPSASQRTAFEDAAAFWRRIIVGDLSDIDVSGIAADACSPGTPVVNETVDDLLIFAQFDDLDGPGGTLAQAGWCFIRTSDNKPVMGIMSFDTADVAGLEAGGDFGSTIRHEMGHVLGIGSLWDTEGFLMNPSDTTSGGMIGADTHFTGPLTISAFDAAGGSTYSGPKVPVENDTDIAGPGTLDGHWRESVFETELMTGFLDGGVPNPTSLVTVQSLADLGYVVNTAVAEPYSLPGPLLSLGSSPGRRIWLKDDIYRGPAGMIDPDGRVVGRVYR